jgi:hypothetical protein
MKRSTPETSPQKPELSSAMTMKWTEFRVKFLFNFPTHLTLLFIKARDRIQEFISKIIYSRGFLYGFLKLHCSLRGRIYPTKIITLLVLSDILISLSIT